MEPQAWCLPTDDASDQDTLSVGSGISELKATVLFGHSPTELELEADTTFPAHLAFVKDGITIVSQRAGKSHLLTKSSPGLICASFVPAETYADRTCQVRHDALN
ncbi:hypothetical protein P7K49_017491 [Saguinus oedipus]|uniref:Uncharacterized protein n=1 Tax=Saguinus oedipus TaxID=9490 RepID=A0ABQ9V3N0_SAGOE|nr:hypothetical protein P7K49_017491 [Saguinus oedipus]